MSAVFLTYVKNEVAKYQKQYKISAGKAFALWYAIEQMDLDETDAFEAVSLDGPNDKDIDLFLIDDPNEKVVIAQFKFKETGKYKAVKGELYGLAHAPDWLKNPESLKRDGRPDIAAAAEEYLQATKKHYMTEFIYVFCGPHHVDVADAERHLNQNWQEEGKPFACKSIDLSLLVDLHEERLGKSRRIKETTLKVAKQSCFEEVGGFGRAIVASLDGITIAKLHKDHGDRLFDRNVRYFLGLRKGSVNAGIRQTLETAKDRKNFWAYNNGLTIVCDKYEFKNGNLKLSNFSIVNGCQTTSSISGTESAALPDVKVLVRFIEAGERVVDSVIQYTNSQTPIRVWDFLSQDKFQKKLKKNLADLSKPYLYVMRPGEVQRLTEPEKKKFRRDGKLQQIRHDLNAQYLGAFNGIPAFAYKNKGLLFTTFKEQVFPTNLDAKSIAFVWTLGTLAHSHVKAELEEAIIQEDQSRVAILKRGASFFCIAIAAYLLKQRNGDHFLSALAGETALSKTTENKLRKYCAFALEWYCEIVQEQIDNGKELSILVRSQEIWNSVFAARLKSKWKQMKAAETYMKEVVPKLSTK